MQDYFELALGYFSYARCVVIDLYKYLDNLLVYLSISFFFYIVGINSFLY